MNKEEKQRLEACLNEIGEILYNNSSTEQVETSETIKTYVCKIANLRIYLSSSLCFKRVLIFSIVI